MPRRGSRPRRAWEVAVEQAEEYHQECDFIGNAAERNTLLTDFANTGTLRARLKIHEQRRTSQAHARRMRDVDIGEHLPAHEEQRRGGSQYDGCNFHVSFAVSTSQIAAFTPDAPARSPSLSFHTVKPRTARRRCSEKGRRHCTSLYNLPDADASKADA